MEIKKRYTLLIELLIAIMLISLCAFPLIDSQISMYKIDLETAVKTLSQQATEQTFREMQKDLYLNPKENKLNLSWDELKNMTTDWEKELPKLSELPNPRIGELPDIVFPLILRSRKTINMTLKREYYVTAFQEKPDGWFSLEYPDKFRMLDVRVNVYRAGGRKKDKGPRPLKDLLDDEKENLPRFLLLVGGAD